jgi:hypothetical protein
MGSCGIGYASLPTNGALTAIGWVAAAIGFVVFIVGRFR